ncbi:MAG: hypothetical protein WCO56_20975 [Verrucomicrobiota bacterium]
MKVTDDYNAKLRLWAANPQVMPLPPACPLPKFSPQKFSSHKAMNRWKAKLLREHARQHSTHG